MTETNQPEVDRSNAATLVWHNPVITRLSLAETLIFGGSVSDGFDGSL
jgi:hypothetical protein